MESKISEVLKSLGFTKNEIIVYLDLLRHSSSSALEIAKRTKLHRSNVYDILRFLENKCIIKKSTEDEKSIFTALEPKALFHYLKEKEKEVEKIIPELENIKKISPKEDTAAVVYGIPGLRQSLQKLMETTEEVKIFNSPSNIEDILGIDFLNDFHKWHIEKKVPLKVIYSRNCPRMEEAKKQPLTYVKCFPGNNESLSAFILCEDNLFFMVAANPPTIIQIKSDKIAEAFNKNFDFTWENLN